MHRSHHTILMDSLKEATHERHVRMAALPFIVALTNGRLPLESYVGQLRTLAVIHGTLEHELALAGPGEIRNLLLGRPSRLVHLRKDLSLFDNLLIPDIAAAHEHARTIAERIRLYRAGHPTDLLGALYVLEGTTLGNTKHLPDVLKTFGGRTAGAAHYYAGYGDMTGTYWREFGDAMDALPVDHDACTRIIQVALDFFDRLEALYLTLYPIQGTTMAYMASMLNPEAGDHPVPSDAREIEAAVAAARKCRKDFPYFDERYQERGRGFAKSDAAWLATLAGLPEAQLLSQVEWLGRVLGNRGMPRITLERQLELLHEELVSAVPEKIAHYKGLIEAAQSLKGERLRCIPEPVFGDLAKGFSVGTDGEMGGRFAGTGVLIVSAVCDEQTGITGAVDSLVPWLTDTERFSPEWTATVLKTLTQAREATKR